MPARPSARPSCPEDPEPPTLRRTGPFLYLRLRRHDYTPDELAAWAARIEPFVADGLDAFVFFRHDEVGRGRRSSPSSSRALTAGAPRLASLAIPRPDRRPRTA